MIFMAGPGHGAPGVLGPCYLEGSYSEVYPDCKCEDEEGLLRLFKQVLASRAGSAATAPLKRPAASTRAASSGYCPFPRVRGRVRQPRPDRRPAVVGDGESETGPLATSWHINKFLNPIRDGAVLPILHLNGYKINNPTLWARVRTRRLEAFFRGIGWTPYFVEGSDPDDDAPGDGGDASTSASPTSAPRRSRPAAAARRSARVGR